MAVTSFQDFDLADPDRECDSVRPRNADADGPVRKTSRMRSTGTHTSGTTRTTRKSSPRTSCSSAMSSATAGVGTGQGLLVLRCQCSPGGGGARGCAGTGQRRW
jgi:hypothetical protein